MRVSLWPILAVMSLAFWSSGAARYFHECTEHRGPVAVADDDDDAGSLAVSAVAADLKVEHPAGQHTPVAHHECVMCQTLAAMAVEPTVPVALPLPARDRVAVLVVADWRAPPVRAAFDCPTTGPPA